MVKEDTRSKRQAIIEAARKIFAMKGYEDTTIAEIAEDAGIAVGTVYLYFGNKRDIYTSVSLDWESEAEIQKHKAADELITGILDNFFRQAIAQGQLAPFDTEVYTKVIFGMVHSVLFECFCVEGGEREELYRERTIEIIERLFFGPSLREGTKKNTDINVGSAVGNG